MIIVGRHQEGITLNPLEYLMDDSGEFMVKFPSFQSALSFMRKQGYEDEDMEFMFFQEEEDQNTFSTYSITTGEYWKELVEGLNNE